MPNNDIEKLLTKIAANWSFCTSEYLDMVRALLGGMTESAAAELVFAALREATQRPTIADWRKLRERLEIAASKRASLRWSYSGPEDPCLSKRTIVFCPQCSEPGFFLDVFFHCIVEHSMGLQILGRWAAETNVAANGWRDADGNPQYDIASGMRLGALPAYCPTKEEQALADAFIAKHGAAQLDNLGTKLLNAITDEEKA